MRIAPLRTEPGLIAYECPMTRSGSVPTLEEAKAQLQKSWEDWKAWAKLDEVP